MITTRGLLLGMTALAVAGLSSGARAQEVRKAAGSPKDITQTSKLEPHEMAASINFPGAFGLPYDSLTTIGSRIDQARKACDPITLASAAHELMVAEKVSDRKASLTSLALMKEATDLGSVRFVPAEIRALALMVGDPAERKALDALAEKAKKHQADRAAAQKDGETSMGLNGWLSVNNFTNDYITITVNGFQVGVAPPHTNMFHMAYITDNPYLPTELNGSGPFGRNTHRTINEVITSEFTWVIGL